MTFVVGCPSSLSPNSCNKSNNFGGIDGDGDGVYVCVCLGWGSCTQRRSWWVGRAWRRSGGKEVRDKVPAHVGKNSSPGAHEGRHTRARLVGQGAALDNV